MLRLANNVYAEPSWSLSTEAIPFDGSSAYVGLFRRKL